MISMPRQAFRLDFAVTPEVSGTIRRQYLS